MNIISLKYYLGKLGHAYIWERVFREKLAEPLHLQAIALLVGIFGSFRQKVYFDLIFRPYHAYAILRAAQRAKLAGLPAISVVEFGVATGAGLLNMMKIAHKVTKITGVQIHLYGFDTGAGLPAPRDYRDHPDFYTTGEYAMQDHDVLRASLKGAELILGDMTETVPAFLQRLSADAPIGFVSIDVDYYWSSVEALKLFSAAEPEKYLKTTYLYCDDVAFDDHSNYAGELLAIAEFNTGHPMRKITRANMLRQKRVMKNAQWIDQMFTLHVLDHPHRQTATAKRY